jgi:hypothetical protein
MRDLPKDFQPRSNGRGDFILPQTAPRRQGAASRPIAGGGRVR